MAMVPKAQWAQGKDVIYLTIDLQDVRDPTIDISNDASSKHGKVSFKGEGKSHATGDEKHQYALDIELFGVCSLRSAVQKECGHPLDFLRCDLHTLVSLVRFRPANAIIELLINITDRGSSQLS